MWKKDLRSAVLLFVCFYIFHKTSPAGGNPLECPHFQIKLYHHDPGGEVNDHLHVLVQMLSLQICTHNCHSKVSLLLNIFITHHNLIKSMALMVHIIRFKFLEINCSSISAFFFNECH